MTSKNVENTGLCQIDRIDPIRSIFDTLLDRYDTSKPLQNVALDTIVTVICHSCHDKRSAATDVKQSQFGINFTHFGRFSASTVHWNADIASNAMQRSPLSTLKIPNFCVDNGDRYSLTSKPAIQSLSSFVSFYPDAIEFPEKN